MSAACANAATRTTPRDIRKVRIFFPSHARSNLRLALLLSEIDPNDPRWSWHRSPVRTLRGLTHHRGADRVIAAVNIETTHTNPLDTIDHAEELGNITHRSDRRKILPYRKLRWQFGAHQTRRTDAKTCQQRCNREGFSDGHRKFAG